MPVQLSSFFLFPCNLSMAPIWLQLKGVIVGIVHFVSDPGQCGSTNDNAVCRCVLGADAHWGGRLFAHSLSEACLISGWDGGRSWWRQGRCFCWWDDFWMCKICSIYLFQEYVGETKLVTESLRMRKWNTDMKLKLRASGFNEIQCWGCATVSDKWPAPSDFQTNWILIATSK